MSRASIWIALLTLSLIATAAAQTAAPSAARVAPNGKQLDCTETCLTAVERTRRQARRLRLTAEASPLDVARVRSEERLFKLDLAELDAGYETYLDSLTLEQKGAFGFDLSELEGIRRSISLDLEVLDGLLDDPRPDSRQIADRTRSLEKSVLGWKLRQQGMASRLGLLR